MASSFEYLINIQQRASGNALSQLDLLKKELDDATATYKQLESAATRANQKLEMNAAAISQLKDISAKAAKSGDKGTKVAADAQITKLVAKEKELAAAAQKANAELHKQGDSTSKLADKAGALKGHEDAQKRLKKHADESASKVAKLKGAFGDLGGPVGSAGQKVFGMADALGDMSESMGPMAAGAAAGAAAIALLVVAIGAAVIAAGVFAVKLADAGRNMKLTLSAITESKAAGSALASSFGEITRATGVGSDRLLALTRSLKDANVSAKDMPAALNAIAMQESALGDQGGTQKLIDQLKSGQKSAGELSKEMSSKFGGIVADKMNSLDGLASRFKGNLSSLFGSLNIEPLLAGLGKLVDLFDENTSTGKTMKTLFESIFQPLLNAAVACIPTVERFMLGVAIAAVRIATFVKPIAGSISKAFQSSSVSKFVDIADVAMVAVYVLAGALGLLALAGLMAAMPFIVLATAIFLGVKYIPKAFTWIKEKVGEAIAWFEELPGKMLQLGKDFINGFINGITGEADQANMATKNVANMVNNTFAGGIEAHSPSRVAYRFGRWYGQGFRGGLEDEADDVEKTVRDVAGPPALEDIPTRGALGPSTRMPAKIEIHIHGDVTRDHLVELEDKLTVLLERAGFSMGLELSNA